MTQRLLLNQGFACRRNGSRMRRPGWGGLITPLIGPGNWPPFIGSMERLFGSWRMGNGSVFSFSPGLHEDRARSVLTRAGADLSAIEFFGIATDRGWTRDFGPIFVTRDRPTSEVAIARFRFTAWARYSDCKNDNRVPVKLASRLACRSFPVIHKGHKVVLEGGSIDVNGVGTALTTEECLLDRDCPGPQSWIFVCGL